jgi:hypothetical protein
LAAPVSTIRFEPNRGQTSRSVRYLARTPQGMVFFTSRALVLSRSDLLPITLEFIGGNSQAVWEASSGTGETTSYHVGRDRRRWAQDVPEYARLTQRNVYPGIDAVYYGAGGKLEYDLLVARDADPGRIRIRIHGADRVSLGAEGELVLSSAGEEIRQYKPVMYQSEPDGSRIPVSGEFRLLRPNEVGFRVGVYDRSRPLAIDPVIESSSYLGGSGDDQVIYSSGNVSAGNTLSADFPDSNPARRKNWDVFYRVGDSTQIIGGSDDDIVTSVIETIDQPVLVGYTSSTDLPTSTQSLQPNFGGGATDGFLFYIGNTGVTNQNGVPVRGPVLSYFGGPGDDRITGGTGSSGACAFTGWTTGQIFGGSGVVQDGPGGGVDGFFAGCNVFSTVSLYRLSLTNFRYFGGSGDDRPSSIASLGADYYIAGQTNSPDFPNLTGASTAPSGDSDAFVIHYSLVASAPTSLLFGGSGADRAGGIAVLADESVAIAGTTTSTDLPLSNPSQMTFGGGDSDAFAAVFRRDLSQMIFATYWGGSSAEEVTSVSADPGGGWYIGGWTSSTDYPVQNAVQPIFGGGPDDGFLLHYDPDGSIHESTFFGGSGSDRILRVNSTSMFRVTLTGQTASADFPLIAPTQTELRGASDGFIAALSTNLINAPHVTGSGGLRSLATLVSPAGSFTLSSSDPASVLLSAGSFDSGSASIALSLPDGPPRFSNYYVDCLSNGVNADILVTAPGFASKTAHIDCVSPSATAAVGGGYGAGVNYANGAFHISAWALNPANVTVYLYATNPANPTDGNFVFAASDTNAVPVQVGVTDPAVLSASTSSIAANGRLALGCGSSPALPCPMGPDMTISPLKTGSSDIVFSSPRLMPGPSEHVPVVVDVPFTLGKLPVIPGGFQVLFGFSCNGFPPPGASITFTSGDADKLVIAGSYSVPGTSTLSLDYCGNVYLQALATAGQVPLTVSVTGFDPVTIPVSLGSPSLTVLSQLLSTPTLAPGQTGFLTVYMGTAGSNGFLLNPQSAPPRLTLATTDSGVLQIIPPFEDLSVGQLFFGFQVQGISPGAADLTLSSSNGAPPPANVNPLHVTVAQQPVQFHDFEVGKDLAAAISVPVPAGLPGNAAFTVSSSDPTEAIVSLSNTDAAQAQVSGSASNGFIAFYVSGLSGSGAAQITLNVEGAAPATAMATLEPSGIGWTNDFLSSGVQTSATSAPIAAYVLDPGTSIPIAAQDLRAGVTAVVQIQSDNPGVAVPASSAVALQRGATVGLRSVGQGDAHLILTQPSGFSVPASRQSLTYRVLPN